VKLLKKLLIAVPLVVGLILVGIFMPARHISIEGFGTLSFETAVTLSVGSEVAYASPTAPTYQSFTEAKSGPDFGFPNNVTSIAVNKPAGTANGDLLIGVVVTDDEAGTFTPPSSWTLINAGTNGTVVTVGAWYKIAGGSEPASYTWSWTNPQTVYAFIVRITGHDSSNPINVSGFATGNSSTPTCPDVNTTVADALVLRIFGANWAQVTVDGGYPSGHTGITVDVSGDPLQIGQCSGGAAYKTQAAFGATGAAAFTMTAAHEWRALTVAIAPPAPPEGPIYQSFAEASNIFDVTSIMVSKPSGTANGDLLIGVVVTDEDAGTFTPPSGWTLINSGTADPGGIADQVTLGTWYKIAGGSEPPSYTWSWTNPQTVYAFIVRITGHDSSNPINVWGVDTGSSTGTIITITCPDVTTTVDDTLVLRIFGADRAMNFGSYPSGHTGITFDSSSGDNTTPYQCTGGAAWQAQATAGATGTADFTAIPNVGTTEEWRALTIAIAPPAAAPDISNTPDTKNFGTVLENSDYWAYGGTTAPTFPLDDGECYFTVTNNSSAAVNIQIKATNFTGGVGWTLTSGSPGQNTVRMKAGKEGDNNEGDMVTLTNSDQGFISGLAASESKAWEIKLETGSFTDSAPKTSTITLTASLA